MDAVWTATDWQNWVLLPALVFCARVADVSLATVRVILVSNCSSGAPKSASASGLKEVASVMPKHACAYLQTGGPLVPEWHASRVSALWSMALAQTVLHKVTGALPR